LPSFHTFPYLFTFQLAFLLYFPNLFTIFYHIFLILSLFDLLLFHNFYIR
jgi:hypothetical protein